MGSPSLHDFSNAFATACRLVFSGDPALLAIVWLSLRVSLSAVFFSCLFGLPLGALLAVLRFPGRQAAIIVVNSLMGLPPVVAGLTVYLLLSRAGPLGALGLLFTPSAMIIAQSVLVTPIVAAIARQFISDLWRDYRDLYVCDGVGLTRAVGSLLLLGRYSLMTAVLAGAGRALAEVGAIVIVGGNIAGATRTMTTAIALETSRGDLALALGLGVILLFLILALNIAAQLAAGAGRRSFA
jgi:tungstate transport system permease protein